MTIVYCVFLQRTMRKFQSIMLKQRFEYRLLICWCDDANTIKCFPFNDFFNKYEQIFGRIFCRNFFVLQFFVENFIFFAVQGFMFENVLLLRTDT